MPPRRDEIERFVNDRSPDAYVRIVDRLLASPHYGERWGKYWLDVAGYADSNGYFNADSDRPFAYRYRDYVIRSVNGDKPFDQFIREQLAGDELSGEVADTPLTPQVVELLTATHFLRNGQDGTSESDGNPDERRTDRATALQSTLQITMNALFGVTVQCARCHDHKFEPVSQADYYALQSIFYPAFPAYDPKHWVMPKDRLREIPNHRLGQIPIPAAEIGRGKPADQKTKTVQKSRRSQRGQTRLGDRRVAAAAADARAESGELRRSGSDRRSGRPHGALRRIAQARREGPVFRLPFDGQAFGLCTMAHGPQ